MLDNIKMVVVFILVFAFCSNIYEALDTLFHTPIKEAYWYLLLLGISGLFLLLSPVESLSNMPKPVFIWLILFLITLVSSYAFSSQSELVNRLVISMVKALSVFVSMFILITNEKILKAGFFALLLVLLVAVGNNAYEFFDESLKWSTIPGRSAGWYYDPNISGRNIVLSLIFSSLFLPQKYTWPIIIIASIGAILTFSRGSWLMLFMAIAGISILQAAKPGQKFSLLDIKPSSFFIMVFGGVIASILLAVFISGQAYEMIKDTPLEEFLSADTIGRLSGDFQDDSANERQDVLLTALKMGVDHPLTGSGLGSTHEWHHAVAPHNDYATLFAERGFLGLASYLFLLGIIWFSGSGYAKLIVLIFAFSSITAHTTFEQPSSYIFIAFALLYQKERYLQDQQHPQPIPT